ncbi:diaminopimelate epimerase [bacterium]|nr:diaminopimelate epimerase [bacterium]MBU1025544.1 diaminopimelate epimerase [bacterium]
MKFTKMQGTGNDFVLVEKADLPENIDLKEFTRNICDRKFGVGSDGLLILAEHAEADFEMIFYNPDGSLAEMCGNGIRCIGKYIYDRDHSKSDKLRIKTGNGILPLKLDIGDDGMVSWVEVAIGVPNFTRSAIPITGKGETALAEQIKIDDGSEFEFHGVSMGNPHAVIFVDNVDDFPVEVIGPQIENHEMFPNRTNVEFVKHVSPELISVRIWERGAGETLSCGTGVCAVAAVSRKLGLTGQSVNVKVPGGDLKIRFDDDDMIYLGGPAVEVFVGKIYI